MLKEGENKIMRDKKNDSEKLLFSLRNELNAYEEKSTRLLEEQNVLHQQQIVKLKLEQQFLVWRIFVRLRKYSEHFSSFKRRLKSETWRVTYLWRRRLDKRLNFWVVNGAALQMPRKIKWLISGRSVFLFFLSFLYQCF